MPLPNPGKKRHYPFKHHLKRKLRKITFMLIAAAIAGGINYYNKNTSQSSTDTPLTVDQFSTYDPALKQSLQKIRAAANQPDSQFWISLQGQVIKLFKDDRKGSQHQKFLIKIAPDITLLISHNIDLAPRVPVRKGDQIQLRGQYEWNNRGGLVHWTHHDPKGKKKGGWIRLSNKEYR